MNEQHDPFEAWQKGHSKIVARELAGLPVDPRWEARLADLDAECRAIEDRRRAAGPAQPQLFDAPQRRWE